LRCFSLPRIAIRRNRCGGTMQCRQFRCAIAGPPIGWATAGQRF
jgi:hypothetical protein